MAEWGRKQYAKPWPSRAHVWTWGAFFLSCLFFVFMVWRDGRVNWTAAERLYLSDYLKSGARAKLPAAKARYTLLEGRNGQGRAGARDRRRDRGGEGPGRALRVRADRRGNQGRTDAVAVDDGGVQRPWAA